MLPDLEVGAVGPFVGGDGGLGSQVEGERRAAGDGGLDHRSHVIAVEVGLDDGQRVAGPARQHHQRGAVPGQLGPPHGVADQDLLGLVDGDRLVDAAHAEEVLGAGHGDQHAVLVVGDQTGGGVEDDVGLGEAAQVAQHVAEQVAGRQAGLVVPRRRRQPTGRP